MSATAASAAGATALAGVTVSIVSLAALHVLPTGLSPLSNAVSQYGTTRYRWGYRAAAIGQAVAAVAIAIGLPSALHGNLSGVTGLLFAFGVTRVVIGWVPMDVPGSEATQTGRNHGVLAAVGFLSVTFTALRFPDVLGGGEWVWISSVSRGVGFYMLAVLVAFFALRRSPALGRYFGLMERAFYLGMIAWLAMVGGGLVAAAN